MAAKVLGFPGEGLVMGAPWRMGWGVMGEGLLVLLAQAEAGFFGGGSEAHWVGLSCAPQSHCASCPVQARLGPLPHHWHPSSHGLLLPVLPSHFVAKLSCLCSLSPLPPRGLGAY